MNQEIRIGVILARGSELWLVRDGSGAWDLPGGPFGEEHDDVDAAMASLLAAQGVEVPDPAGSFLETLFFAGAAGQRIVYNLYLPVQWNGEPRPPAGGEGAWFPAEELPRLAMAAPVREAVMAAFGLCERTDDTERIAADFANFLAGGSDAAPPASSSPTADRRQAGLDVARTLMGGDPAAAYRLLKRDYRELADDIVDFAFGDIWARPGLDRKTRSLLVVAMLATQGRPTALRAHLKGALNHGATREELAETLRTVAAYSGFPAALEAWPIMEEVVAEFERKRERRRRKEHGR
ncbi:hypothetical protein HRbin29_01054 [bacterium HR29]|jgi:4-carboxymuconolactone decarboxylase|nr:hypothetical protein HRbin29_01054 [bacterium HR29]